MHTPRESAQDESTASRPKWAGLIAAAGDSARMGSPKALLKNREGLSFVVALSQAFLEAGIAPVFVTVPGSPVRERIAESLAGLPVQIVLNEAPERGLAGSVQTAIRSMPESHAGLVLCPVDAPFASGSLIRGMVDSLDDPRGGWLAVVASYEGRHGHPVAFGRSLFGDLQDCHRSQGPRSVLRTHAPRVLSYPWHDADILQNLNTPEAYQVACAKRVRDFAD